MIIFVFVVFGRQWGKLFLIDWSAFILFWICYDMMRGVADSIRGTISVAGPFLIEQRLFGWLTPAEVPAFYLQQFQATHAGTPLKTLLDVGSALTYGLHFVAPLLLGWLFWHTLDERRTFYLFVSSFTLLNVAALITFMVYPAAPPWYVANYGFAQPSGGMLESAAALINFDKLIGQDFFLHLYGTFNANLFAAIPSLHAGYPTLIALCLWLRFGGWTWLFFIYLLWAWISAVYLNHHYVIDLLIGSAYALVALLLAKTLLVPHVLDRLIDYGRTSRLVLSQAKRP